MAEPDGARKQAKGDWSFLAKLIGAALLAAIAQGLFVFERVGTTIGGFALLLLIVVVALRPIMLRSRASRVALAAAAIFALVLAADPGPLALLLYWTMLTLAALFARMSGFDDGWRWMLRLALHGLLSPFMPIRDALIFSRARRRRKSVGFMRIARMLILPVLGSLVFLGLFAAANPLIENFFQRLQIDPELSSENIIRLIFWGLIALAIWSLLRPPRLAIARAVPTAETALALPDIGSASVILSLAAFNLVFALQNGLDLAFLWSGAPLPGDLTLAEYAHRGAYSLIVTALLAGLLVLAMLRPGSATARSGAVRLLVTVWIAQNLLLVASTMLRTFDYIESYSLTELRIAALIWMGLVATGLVLICYRLLTNRSAAWLINANMLAALLVLGACTCVDLGRMAAAWNVRHAREVGGRGVELDLCYLRDLGPSALLPLLELETRPGLPAPFRDRITWLRGRMMENLAANQRDWRGWTLRGAGRLAEAQNIVAERHLPAWGTGSLNCSPEASVTATPPPVIEMNAVDANILVPDANEAAAPLTGNAAR